jgi:hypothetical protein
VRPVSALWGAPGCASPVRPALLSSTAFYSFGTSLPAKDSIDMQNEVDIDIRLPYLTASLPGFGGKLRATPEDFVVEEVGLYEAAGDGQHLYVNLTKVG